MCTDAPTNSGRGGKDEERTRERPRDAVRPARRGQTEKQ